ncbi:MAG TPA: hypothetical protein VGG14_07975 [Candidatus Sulfotelmatobacter sp.]|jgi:ABC-type phosphate transport system substrate-binding protein
MNRRFCIAHFIAAISVMASAWFAWRIACAPVAEAGGVPIVVIVNVSNPVGNLSTSELKKIFLSDRSRWDTGTAVAAVIPAQGAGDRTSFLKIVCGMRDADFNKYFLQAAFSGKLTPPPKEVSNSAALKSFVATTPGAIGFIKGGDFHGDGSDGGVKAVRVDGIAAGDSDYKLRM